MTYLMRPFPRSCLDNSKRIFNYRLSRARRCVECAFGIMSAKFLILKKSIETNVNHAIVIVKATCILHNVIIDKDGIDHDLTNETAQNDGVLPDNLRNRNSRQIAINIRDRFKEYFTSNEGISNLAFFKRNCILCKLLEVATKSYKSSFTY